MAGQRLLHNLPRHGARRLIADLFAVHDAAHRTLDVETLLRIHLLADDQIVEALQMDEVLAPAERYRRIARVVDQLFEAHGARLCVRPLGRIDDLHEAADHVAGMVDAYSCARVMPFSFVN